MPRARPRPAIAAAHFGGARLLRGEAERLLVLLGIPALQAPGLWRNAAIREVARWVGLLNNASRRGSSIPHVLVEPPSASDFVASRSLVTLTPRLIKVLSALSTHETQRLASAGIEVHALTLQLEEFSSAVDAMVKEATTIKARRGRPSNIALREAVTGLSATYRRYHGSGAAPELDFIASALAIGDSAWMRAAPSERRRRIRALLPVQSPRAQYPRLAIDEIADRVARARVTEDGRGRKRNR